MNYETSIDEICSFIRKVYVRKDLKGFSGSHEYLEDRLAQTWFGMALACFG